MKQHFIFLLLLFGINAGHAQVTNSNLQDISGFYGNSLDTLLTILDTTVRLDKIYIQSETSVLMPSLKPFKRRLLLKLKKQSNKISRSMTWDLVSLKYLHYPSRPMRCS